MGTDSISQLKSSNATLAERASKFTGYFRSCLMYATTAVVMYEFLCPAKLDPAIKQPGTSPASGKTNLQRIQPIADINTRPSFRDLAKPEWKILKALNNKNLSVVTVTFKDSLKPQAPGQLLIVTFNTFPTLQQRKDAQNIIKIESNKLEYIVDFNLMHQLAGQNQMLCVLTKVK